MSSDHYPDVFFSTRLIQQKKKIFAVYVFMKVGRQKSAHDKRARHTQNEQNPWLFTIYEEKKYLFAFTSLTKN